MDSVPLKSASTCSFSQYFLCPPSICHGLRFYTFHIKIGILIIVEYSFNDVFLPFFIRFAFILLVMLFFIDDWFLLFPHYSQGCWRLVFARPCGFFCWFLRQGFWFQCSIFLFYQMLLLLTCHKEKTSFHQSFKLNHTTKNKTLRIFPTRILAEILVSNLSPFRTWYFWLFSSSSALCLYQSSYKSLHRVMNNMKPRGPALAG